MANTTYLKRAQLSGYKSVQHADIEFHPGLNIIIGYNGVGKTNFMKFLRDCVAIAIESPSEIKYNDDIDVCLTVSDGSKIIYTKKDENALSEKDKILRQFLNINRYNYSFINNEEKILNVSDLGEMIFYLFNNNLFIDPLLIPHGLPPNLSLLHEPIVLDFKMKNVTISSMESIIYNKESLQGGFIPSLELQLKGIAKILANVSHVMKIEALRTINEMGKEFLLSDLLAFNLIEDINVAEHKISSGINHVENTFTISGIEYSYKVNGEYLSFKDLSDGTQRIIYIISEIINDLRPVYKNTNEKVARLILLEEPELGIHPHLLHQLLVKLRSVSEDSQVIMTTHSPQVLDILEIDELDRIIIADYDPQKGTVLRHLTDEQMEQAREYIVETGSLSTYWLNTFYLQNPQPHPVI